MHRYFEMRMSFQNLQERKIALRVGGLENVLEVADGLMIVNGEGEFELLHRIREPFFFVLKKAMKRKSKVQTEKLKATIQNLKLPLLRISC